jgi:CxxC-x17-CxxC domain-containing protein
MEDGMAKKINLKAEKAKRNLDYALRFKKRKKRSSGSKPAFETFHAPATAPGHAVVCTTCGVETTVPFKPTQGRPVLCRSCFQLAA